jgi:hypothetical protein
MTTTESTVLDTTNALKSSPTIYVMALVAMVFIGVASIVMVEVLRPNQDNMVLHGLILGFLTPTTMSLLSLLKANETHTIVNSRMTALLEMTQKAAFARGQLEGPSTNPQTQGDRAT